MIATRLSRIVWTILPDRSDPKSYPSLRLYILVRPADIINYRKLARRARDSKRGENSRACYSRTGFAPIADTINRRRGGSEIERNIASGSHQGVVLRLMRRAARNGSFWNLVYPTLLI